MLRKIMISPRTGGWSKEADICDSAIRPFADNNIVAGKELRLNFQLVIERLKIAKDIFPSPVVD